MVGFFKKQKKQSSKKFIPQKPDSDDGTVPTNVATSEIDNKTAASEITINPSAEEDAEEFDMVPYNKNHTWVAQQAFVRYESFGECPVSDMLVSRYDHFPMKVDDEMCVVKVEASTVTNLDCIMREGHWCESVSLPIIPGFDFVGEIVNCGKGAYQKGFQVGDRVASFIRSGGNARYLTCSVLDLIKVPHDIDGADAVCMIMPYMAAFQCLNLNKEGFERYRSNSLSEKKVLVSGGEGLIGQAAVQLARVMGASKIYAIVPDRCGSFVKFLGAEPIFIGSDIWPSQLEGQIDILIDCNEAYSTSYHSSMSQTGIFVRVADVAKGPNGLEGLVDAVHCMASGVQSYKFLDKWDNHKDEFKADLQCLFGYLKTKDFEPTINDKIALKSIPIAQKNISIARNASTITPTIVCLPWIKHKDEERVSSEELIKAAENRVITAPVSASTKKGKWLGKKGGKQTRKAKKIFSDTETVDTMVHQWRQNDEQSVQWLWADKTNQTIKK